MLEVTEACVNEARLPPCYDKVPPVVASGWHRRARVDDDPRVADALRRRGGDGRAARALSKRWNRNNNDELAVSITVSDHCGTQYITSVAEALGPAWTVGEGFFAGKKWKGGFLSIPDRTARWRARPRTTSCCTRRASTTIKLNGWWRSDC